MMRTLLDRLLFALPSPPSRASLVRGGLYLLFGLLLYGLFLGVLYMRELGVVGLRQWCGRLPGVQVSMSRPEMSFFPPALEIADLTVQPPNASEPLAFRNVRAGLTVFPLGISLDADIAGGELNATVIPSSLWNPERLAVRSSLSGVGIEPLLRPFMGKTSLVQIRSGKLDGSVTLDLPLLNGRPEPLAGEGSLNLSLRGGVADLSLPMLKSSRLDKLEGTVETVWKKDRLTLHQLAVRSPMLACTVQGQITLVPRDLPASRRAVSMIVGRDTKELTETGVVKAAVETVAENTSDGILAPMFYMVIGGPVLGYFYKAVNTMDSMVGYKNDKFLYFGRAAAKFDDVMNFLPSRISGILMVLAAPLVKLDGKNAWKIFKRDRLCHASPNSAQTESVMAGALQVQLAGDAWYFGKKHEKPTIGDPIRPVEIADIARANRLLYAASALGMIVFNGIKIILLLLLL